MVAVAALTYLTATIEWFDYRPDDAGGNAFLEHMPDDVDAAYMVTAFPGPTVGGRWPWGEPSLQVIVRAAPYDHEGGRTRAQEIIDALDRLDGVIWDEGGPHELVVEGCTHRGQGPAPIGRDDRQRPEWSLNFDLHTQNPTSHRVA